MLYVGRYPLLLGGSLQEQVVSYAAEYECGKEYLYKPLDVRRNEQHLPESFTPHPLFRD